MDKEVDAVIVGAGVAGSGMACALANNGWEVVVFDKSAYPRHKACGEFLSPESRSVLRAFELDKEVRTLRPAEIVGVRIHSERGVSLEIPLPGSAWGVSRHALDARLQQSAEERGALVRTGTPVTAITEDGGRYRVEYRSGREAVSLRSRIVIGAWGRRPYHARDLRQTSANPGKEACFGIKSHYAGTDRLPIVDLYFFRGGYIGISPIEGDRINVAAILSPSVFRQFGGPSAIERLLDEAARRVPSLRRRLDGATPVPGTDAASAPFSARRKPVAWKEFPCIGDAAAVIPPFCGDGMAMALRSAELCAPLADSYLRKQRSLAEWRESYSRSIKRDFTGPLRWGGLLEFALTHSAVAPWLLRLGAIAPKMAERLVRATRLR